MTGSRLRHGDACAAHLGDPDLQRTADLMVGQRVAPANLKQLDPVVVAGLHQTRSVSTGVLMHLGAIVISVLQQVERTGRRIGVALRDLCPVVRS